MNEHDDHYTVRGDRQPEIRSEHSIVNRIATHAPGAAAVYMIALQYADWRHGTCYPSRETLAERCGNITVRSLDRKLSELEHAGAVIRIATWQNKGGYGYHRHGRSVRGKGELLVISRDTSISLAIRNAGLDTLLEATEQSQPGLHNAWRSEHHRTTDTHVHSTPTVDKNRNSTVDKKRNSTVDKNVYPNVLQELPPHERALGGTSRNNPQTAHTRVNQNPPKTHTPPTYDPPTPDSPAPGNPTLGSPASGRPTLENRNAIEEPPQEPPQQETPVKQSHTQQAAHTHTHGQKPATPTDTPDAHREAATTHASPIGDGVTLESSLDTPAPGPKRVMDKYRTGWVTAGAERVLQQREQQIGRKLTEQERADYAPAIDEHVRAGTTVQAILYGLRLLNESGSRFPQKDLGRCIATADHKLRNAHTGRTEERIALAEYGRRNTEKSGGGEGGRSESKHDQFMRLARQAGAKQLGA